MGRGKRRHLAPFEIEIEALGPRGVGIGHTPDGAVMKVRCAAPGSRVFVRPAGRRKGIWNGRRQHLVRPPADAVTPDCPVFGLCGGCSLQELSHAGQQRAKEAMSHVEVANGWCQAIPDDVRLHEVRGATASYGYRNKVELSFGGSRYLSEDDHAKGLAIDGKTLCNAIDEDGGYNSTCDPNAFYSNNGTGPGWSSYSNDGCPHDDASSATFIAPGSRLPWDTSATLNMYAR